MMCSAPWYLQGKYWATCKLIAAIGFPATLLISLVFVALGMYIGYRLMNR